MSCVLPPSWARLSRAWRAVMVGPFEMAIGIATAIIGFGGIISGVSLVPASIDDVLPVWLVYAWSVGLALGGVFTVAGRLVERDRMEAIGLGLLVYGNAAYCSVLLVSAHWPTALPTFAIMFAIVVGSILRIHILSKARRLLKEANAHCEDD